MSSAYQFIPVQFVVPEQTKRDGIFADVFARHLLELETEAKPQWDAREACMQPVYHMVEEQVYPEGDYQETAGEELDLPLVGSHFSVAAWVKPEADIGDGGIFGWGNYREDQACYMKFIRGGAQYIDGWVDEHGGWEVDLKSSVADGKFHHFAVTWDGCYRRVFMDFIKVLEEKDCKGPQSTYCHNFTVGVTDWREPQEAMFSGAIKGLKIWKGAALSAEELKHQA